MFSIATHGASDFEFLSPQVAGRLNSSNKHAERMIYVGTVVLIGTLVWFIIQLQRWRKTILQSISPFASAQEKRRTKAYAYLIDVFSLGLMFLGVMQVLFVVGAIDL